MNRIKELRESQGLSQKQLAEMAKISAPYLCDLESNRRGAKPETYKRIADVLGIPVSDLMKEC